MQVKVTELGRKGIGERAGEGVVAEREGVEGSEVREDRRRDFADEVGGGKADNRDAIGFACDALP